MIDANRLVVKAVPGGVFAGYFDSLVNTVTEVIEVIEVWGAVVGSE